VTRLVPRTVVVREVITRVVTPPPSAGPAEFVLCLRRKPAHLDPLWRAGESESLVWGLLGRTVAAARPDGTWMTDVFERVPTLKNGDARLVGEEGPDGHLEVTYHIRPDVRWEDGTRVTAADFRRAWEAARQGHGSPRVRQLAADVVDVRVPDARTLTVILRQGLMTPLYPGYALGPLPPTGLATSRSFPSFGPYRLAATFPNGDMLFVPNPTFGPPPHLPQVRMRVVPDPNNALVALLGGRCDLLAPSLLDVTALPWLQRAQQQGLISYRALPDRVWTHLDFNTWPPEGHLPFFADRRVRQAVALTLDRERLREEATSGQGRRMASWILPGQWAYAPQSSLRFGRPDLQRARVLLAEAGWQDRNGDGVLDAKGVKGTFWDGTSWTIPDGTPFRITLWTVAGDTEALRTSEIVREQLASVGIRVHVRSLSPAEFFGKESPLWRRTFDLAIFSWVMEPDPGGRYLWLGNAICRRANGSLYAAEAGHPCEPGDELLHAPQIPTRANAEQGGDVSGWADQDASLAVYRATAFVRPVERMPYYEAHQRLFALDLPVLPLFQRPLFVAWRTGWSGIQGDGFLPLTWDVQKWRWNGGTHASDRSGG